VTALDIAPVMGLYLLGLAALLRHPQRLIAYTAAVVLGEAFGSLAFWATIDFALIVTITFAHCNQSEVILIRYQWLGVSLVTTIAAGLVDDRPGVISLLFALFALAYTVDSDNDQTAKRQRRLMVTLSQHLHPRSRP
jgi:hypothetical protein